MMAFYHRIGLRERIENGELDVRQIWMHTKTNRTLKRDIYKTCRKQTRYRVFTDAALRTMVDVDWLNYGAVDYIGCGRHEVWVWDTLEEALQQAQILIPQGENK